MKKIFDKKCTKNAIRDIRGMQKVNDERIKNKKKKDENWREREAERERNYGQNLSINNK